MRPNFKNLEWNGFDRFDLDLLRSWNLTRESPGARKMVLIGRLQRELGFLSKGGNYAFAIAIDGRYGPHTDKRIRIEEEDGEPLGPELAAIVNEERSKAKWAQQKLEEK
jgi:hypothetical protein